MSTSSIFLCVSVHMIMLHFLWISLKRNHIFVLCLILCHFPIAPFVFISSRLPPLCQNDKTSQSQPGGDPSSNLPNTSSLIVGKINFVAVKFFQDPLLDFTW